MKTIVVINDFTTCEEIALGIQMPLLRDMGHKVLPIPSKLLSYPLCVEGAAALETVDFAKSMLSFFLYKNEKIDAVLTGFIPNVELVTEIKEFCIKEKLRGAAIFVDPVLGDNGKSYKSVKPENIESMKNLVAVADICFPNYTESCILTDTEYKSSGISIEEAHELLGKLKTLGVKVPLITGCNVDANDVVIYLDANDQLQSIPFEKINGHIAGTGDRFAAGVAGRLLKGLSMDRAVREAETEITERIKAVNG